MMNTLQNTEPEVFGLFELNKDGTVLYSKNADLYSSERLTKLVGLNFFDEAAPFENREEFRAYLKRFMQSGFPSETFNFTCQKENQIIPAKVMLVRITERQNSDERAETVIVDIRRA